jgi:hypothetical protein
MTSLSMALEGMRNNVLESQRRMAKSSMPQPGSMAGDGKPNTQLTTEVKDRSLQAKPATTIGALHQAGNRHGASGRMEPDSTGGDDFGVGFPRTSIARGA